MIHEVKGERQYIMHLEEETKIHNRDLTRVESIAYYREHTLRSG